MSDKTSSRYPYTYASDYLRAFGGADSSGAKMSRSEASQIRGAVAKALGMDDAELAAKLADYYLANDAEVSEKSMRDLIAALGMRSAI